MRFHLFRLDTINTLLLVTVLGGALVEELSASVKSMQEQAACLLQALSVFKLVNARAGYARLQPNPLWQRQASPARLCQRSKKKNDCQLTP